MSMASKKNKKSPEEKIQKKRDIQQMVTDDINDKFGIGTVITTRDVELMNKCDARQNIIPAESMSFNDMTAIGGLVKGRTYLIYGPPAIGKSTTSLALFKPSIKMGYKLLFCDMEHKLDVGLLDSMNIDRRDSTIFQALIRPQFADEGFEAIHNFLQLGKPLFIIMDSISKLNVRRTNKQAQKGYGRGKQPGAKAKAMSEFLTETVPLISRTQSVFIMIAQESMHGIGGGVTYLGPNCGCMPAFDATCIFRVSKPKDGGEIVKNNQVIGRELIWEFKKITTGLPPPKRSIAIKYGCGFYIEYEAVQRAIQKGIIVESGAWFEFQGQKIQGLMNMVEFFENDKKALEQLRREVK